MKTTLSLLKNRLSRYRLPAVLGAALLIGVGFSVSLFVYAEAVAQDDSNALADAFVPGHHYELLSAAQPVQTGEKIEVAELFWYRCPHCYRLEPYLDKWLQTKPSDVELVPIPAVLNERWAVDARRYYTLVAIGMTEPLHAAMFAALHKAGRPLRGTQAFIDWAVENGADRAQIIAAYDSFGVSAKVQFAAVMSRKYGLSGVPAIIVDGKYRTSVSLAGGHAKLLDLIDHLVKKARQERVR